MDMNDQSGSCCSAAIAVAYADRFKAGCKLAVFQRAQMLFRIHPEMISR